MGVGTLSGYLDIHVEATKDIATTVRAIRKAGARAGLALKPGTSIDDYAQFVDEVDMFLIMTVEPGFGGQKFMHQMMEKIKKGVLLSMRLSILLDRIFV